MNDLTVLKDFIAEYEIDHIDEKAIDVMFYLAVLMGEDSKAPMPLMNVIRVALDLNPDTEIEDVFEDGPEPEELFVFIESEDGRRWFPIFTDMKEIDGAEKTNAVREVPIKSIVEAALDAEVIDGIMINPNSDAFAIADFALEFLLEKAEELKGIKGSGVDVRPASSKNKKNG